ncbi:MAG: hypothetical protein GY913_03750 [Proteobacteria bacterium]|nr:hypothetical protein [Pseudomonadota bacterium]
MQDVDITNSGCAGTGTCYGGLVEADDSSTLNLYDVSADSLEMSSNGYMYGAVLRVYGSTLDVDGLTITNSTFSSGSNAYLYGGLINAHNADGQFNDVTMTDNEFNAQYYFYGAFGYYSNSDFEITNSTFEDNTITVDTHSSGDASYPFVFYSGAGSNLEVENTSFSWNEVYSNDDIWAPIYLAATSGTASFDNVLITDNWFESMNATSSNAAYGMFYDYYTDLDVTNSDIANNHWEGFDYIYAVLGQRSYDGDMSFTNVNIVNNTAVADETRAGLLYSSDANDSGSGEFEMNYSNTYGNWDDFSYGYDWYDGGSDGDFTAFTGNISDDPLYTDASTGDYTLASGSPAIDAGDPSILDTDGTTSDIGAYGGPDAAL